MISKGDKHMEPDILRDCTGREDSLERCLDSLKTGRTHKGY